MPRNITETAIANSLQIRFYLIDDDTGASLLQRAHVEASVAFTRSDTGAQRVQTITFKIADDGPQVPGAQKLTEALLDDDVTPATNQFSGAERTTLISSVQQVKQLAEEILNFT